MRLWRADEIARRAAADPTLPFVAHISMDDRRSFAAETAANTVRSSAQRPVARQSVNGSVREKFIQFAETKTGALRGCHLSSLINEDDKTTVTALVEMVAEEFEREVVRTNTAVYELLEAARHLGFTDELLGRTIDGDRIRLLADLENETYRGMSIEGKEITFIDEDALARSLQERVVDAVSAAASEVVSEMTERMRSARPFTEKSRPEFVYWAVTSE